MRSYTTKEIGDIGEDYAVKYLTDKNYKIISRNFKSKIGEIDIIAENKEYIIFVEVKTRHINSLTHPYEAVNKTKQRKIINTARYYLMKYSVEKYCRFDVCEVIVERNNLKLSRINHIKSAFE
jgi:putative endonuclease